MPLWVRQDFNLETFLSIDIISSGVVWSSLHLAATSWKVIRSNKRIFLSGCRAGMCKFEWSNQNVYHLMVVRRRREYHRDRDDKTLKLKFLWSKTNDFKSQLKLFAESVYFTRKNIVKTVINSTSATWENV